MPDRPEGVPPRAIASPQQAGYTIWVHGAQRTRLRDAYHSFLRIRWLASLALIALGFFLVNVMFALLYFIVGGVDGVAATSFFDALMFSVETLGTIGYGVMHPVSHAASVVVIVESIAGIMCVALITGLVFAKFARPTARIAFTKHCVICQHEGKPTLMFRCGNERSNVIVEARIHVVATIVTATDPSRPFYKLHDLELVRDRIGGLRRGWSVMHVIDETSPLYQLDAAGAAKAEVEIEIAIMGFDDVTLQTVHAMHQYSDKDLLFGHRFADTLTIVGNGDMLLDATKFHDTVPET
ncbi:MAG: ion channel [Kofleriaceae bacterium]